VQRESKKMDKKVMKKTCNRGPNDEAGAWEDGPKVEA
jgi:hypothetical protein